MRLCANALDPESPAKMDVALANFVHCKGLSFNLAEDDLMTRIIEITRTLDNKYRGPNRNRVGGELLDGVYNTNQDKNLDSIVDEAEVFGIAGYGDLATIDKYACINFLAAGANNPFAILDIVDCSDRCAAGEKKSAEYISGKFIPLIEALEDRSNKEGKKCKGIMDLLLFDGATNVQNAGQIMAARYPRLTVLHLHGAEHAISLVFGDLFKKVTEFKRMTNICRKVRNVFGCKRHATTAMFRKRAKEHNNGRLIGLIKVSECR